MASTAGHDEGSPLSSEFEDLGMDETPSTSKSTGAGGESDWTEGGEEVTGARRGSSFTGSAAAVDTSQAASRARPPLAQTMSSATAQSSEIQPQTQSSADATQATRSSRTPGEADDRGYSTLKEIEDAGHKVADFTKNAANDLTKKLFGGSGSAEETFSIKGIAEGVSSWWSSLDTSQLVPDSGPSSRTAAAAQSKSDAQQLFGLPVTEEVLEKFACTLAQTYRCSHNAFTGPQEVTWRGVLFITNRHSCWKADTDSSTLMLPHGDVTSVAKTETGSKGSLRVAFGDEGEFLVLRDFVGAEGVDGALALLEHVTTDN